MQHEYERPQADRTLLRLHLNENTAGCSPVVLEALRGVTPLDVSTYPDYDEVQAEAAAYFGVRPSELLLVNGLDEGILAGALVARRRSAHVGQLETARSTVPDEPAPMPATPPEPTGQVAVAPEALIVLPAFDMYASCADAAGLHVVQVPPHPDLSFPLDRVIDAMTSATRILFITTPGNPTGESLPFATIEALRDALPNDAILFVDEAYVGFGRQSLSGRLGRGGTNRAQVLIGRTFSKTHGLAGVRAGALIGDASLIQDVARLVPPYSVNAFAVAAVRAAVRDTAYVDWYAREVATSRAMLFELCDRLGLFCWRSEANFVLVKVGDRSADLVRQLARRGIAVRDRGNEPGCAGCIRITAGVVEHTRRLVDAMEQILCGAR